jgi:PmbA protein
MIEDSQKPTIYLTSNWYTRFTSQAEGTFSTIPRDGSFLIENGEIKQSVRKIRLSDNLLRMSANISAMGKNVPQIQWWEVETPTFLPAIKVDNCTITPATD